MKKYLFFAAAALTLAGCASDDYIGEGLPGGESAKRNAIVFSGYKPNMQRAQETGTTAATTLGENFSVLGTKTVNNVVSNVFAHTSYFGADGSTKNTIGDGQLYDVWFTSADAWEYIGSGTPALKTSGAITLPGEQTIKYWDHAASAYNFIAYANKGGIASDKITDVTTAGFKVTASAAQLAQLFVADKKEVLPTNYRQPVTFTFRSSAAKVRLGIYEEIPGYKVTSITFRSAATPAVNFQNSSTNAILDGGFIGATTGEQAAVVGFDGDGKAQITFEGEAGKAKFFDFGAFTVDANNPMGVTSGAATFTAETFAIPNVSNLADMTLYVDYTLTSEKDNTAETIIVHGAKAIVPAASVTWKPNHAYTYLFKITDETNGSTGGDGTSPAGLYPITFDAVVETESAAETTVTTEVKDVTAAP